ncbi:hypothetical protein BH23ACT9_BH23ACT9_38260 [soil metagenome]
MTRIAALLTCHNRRDTTVEAVRALSAQTTEATIDLVLHDDGSTDGTADAVRAVRPEVRVVQGDGNRYWCGGMRAAWGAVLVGGYDHYLWVNDDTVLDPEAVAALLDVYATQPGSVVVGATRDPETGEPTYGGVVRTSSTRPLNFTRVAPADEPRGVDTMNGNCVLVPQAVVEQIGILDEGFTHGLGDFDYGLRASRAGFAVVVAPGTIGTCSRNPESPSGRPGLKAAREEWRRMMGVKAIPPSEWRRFAARHAGPLWPLYWASPYVRRIVGRATRG